MTADEVASGGTRQPVLVGELIIRRLKDGRARASGISTYQLAERLSGMTGGRSRLSANVLQNLEAGRRQQAVTVEEMLLLALGLGVPPEFFLAPAAADRVQLAPDVVVDAETFLAWVQGRLPVPPTDPQQYAQVSAEVLGDTSRSGNGALKAEFLRAAASMLDGFFADSDQIIAKTRGQVRDLLTELRQAVADGADRDELLGMLDGHLDRLPTD